ncbi:hypothetical protein [Kordiimonas lacus]|uniref:HNH endonuclease n=1 Tax=Kordiimonas lacus TaxID=637679 RepID=A0A1G7B6M6_9PROT|nr:hypothetical protein [Kordiimonas lacus]SDE22774.1 hypothetical protein SAMN04488071_2389 [Kordiimonas lacus]
MTLLDRMKSISPTCILCGGQNPTETTDHIPPKSIFFLKQRPRGLEFPACRACNQGSKLDDQVVGWFSRIYPDPEADAETKELNKLTKSVQRNVPGLLAELQATDSQLVTFRKGVPAQYADKHVLSADGPILNEIVGCFGAKMGIALHFEKTGRVVPVEGRAAVKWYTNYQAITGDIPTDALSLLGAPETLQMGKWEVSDQFQYSSAWLEDGRLSLHYATFRRSFAILVAVFASNADLIEGLVENSAGVFQPGWLIDRQPKFKRLKMW